MGLFLFSRKNAAARRRNVVVRTSRAVVETMESRRMFSVAVPANALPVGDPIVAQAKGPVGPNYVTQPVFTGDLKDGVSYFLVASGAHRLANSPQYRAADAQYYQDTSGQWQPSGGTHLLVDGVSRWRQNTLDGSGILNPDGWLDVRQTDHQYAAVVTKDNAGSISVQVYELLPPIDLDIDTDNDDSTHRTSAEDDAEETAGKVIVANNGDVDGDEVEDVADFAIAGSEYTSLFLELPASIPTSHSLDVTLTYDPTVLRVWRKDAADTSRTSADIVASGSAYDAAWLGAAPGAVTTLFVEALDGSYALHSIEASVRLVNGSLITVLADKVTTAPTRLDLEAAKMQVGENGNTTDGLVAEGPAEDKPGVYVPVNDDDDDYDAANKPDRDQDGLVVGEDDLLPMTVKAFRGAAAAGGTQRLLASEGLRVWRKNGEENELVTRNTPLPLDRDTQIWVEGFSVGARNLRLAFADARGQIQEAQLGGDTMRVNVFKWTGPLNVPEHGIFKYTAGPANLPAGAKWVEPDGGDISVAENPKAVTIKWRAGPAVARAVLQVDDNYTWGLNLNVVEVKVEVPDVGQAFKAGTPVDGAVEATPQVGKVKHIVSGDPVNDPGLRSRAKVTLTGPLNDRGVKQMRVGFSQNVVLARLRVKYNGIVDARVSSLEGNQVRLDGNPQGTKPYYDTKNAASVFFDPSPEMKTKTLQAEDTPGASIPVFYNKNNVAQNDVDSVDLQYDWDLYIIAATTDERNDAHEVFVRQAQATGGWHWTVNQDLGAGPNYAFTPNAAATVKPPTGWEEIEGPEQDETQPWALPAYRDLTHWLGN